MGIGWYGDGIIIISRSIMRTITKCALWFVVYTDNAKHLVVVVFFEKKKIEEEKKKEGEEEKKKEGEKKQSW